LRTFSAITSRRPFTLLGILLALLVIVAFVLVALNASTSGSSPLQTVVVASKDLLPRVPIPADSLSLRSIPVPATYPKVYFASVQQVQGMVPLVTINSGQAVSANDVARPNQALGSQSEYLPIPKGYVALTIPTSEQQGVADYIQPGDYIRLEMPYGTFVYRTTMHRIVTASNMAVLRSPRHEQLELQACHPRFFATHRYLAYAVPIRVTPRGNGPVLSGTELAAAR